MTAPFDLTGQVAVITGSSRGIGRSAAELQWDLNYMLKLWSAIDEASKSGKGAFLIYQESSLVIRAIRDYFTADIGEILIDTDDIFDQAHQFMNHVMPESASKVKRYRDDAALFSRFQIEHQIETAFSRTVIPANGRGVWSTIDTPVRRVRWVVSRVTSAPMKLTLPAVGGSSPLTARSSVVLPAPLGPTRATISPSSTLNDTPSTALSTALR